MRAKVSGADQGLLKVLECCEGGTPDLWSWSGVEGNGWLDGCQGGQWTAQSCLAYSHNARTGAGGRNALMTGLLLLPSLWCGCPNMSTAAATAFPGPAHCTQCGHVMSTQALPHLPCLQAGCVHACGA